MNAIALYKLLLVLLIGAALPVAAAPPAGRENMPAWRYTVRPGDTLINIAERHLTDVGHWPAVQKANQIDDPYRLLPGTVLRIPASMLRRAPAAVTVETRNGAVRWRTATGDWQDASEGQRLAAGSTLETLDNASALLRLADGSRVLLSANSQIVFDALGAFAGGLMVDTRLRLQRGQGDITANPARRANQHLQIQTPAAQVVVRGTRFRVAVDSDATREETLFGLVGVRAAGRGVSVPSGRGTIARAGQPPVKPVLLLGAPEVSALPTRFEYLPLVAFSDAASAGGGRVDR